MFIGEGPGANEDKQGRPFVGAAGKFLDELLAQAGVTRADVWITNVVKCRPPGNRDPEVVEIETCQYPDSDKIMIASRKRGGLGLWKMFKAEDAVEYYERESNEPPAP